MSIKPITFRDTEIPALLDGRKTQHRVALKPQPLPVGGPFYRPSPRVKPREWNSVSAAGFITNIQIVPYAPGDLLWVRECWRPRGGYSNWDVIVRYRADGAETHFCDGDYDRDGDWNWPKAADKGFVPSIHMPRWASRLTLRVSDVRVQRLQEISEADAVAEGVPLVGGQYHDERSGRRCSCTIAEFRDLWDSINEKRGHGWEAHPWVCAVSFEVIRANVGEVVEQAA